MRSGPILGWCRGALTVIVSLGSDGRAPDARPPPAGVTASPSPLPSRTRASCFPAPDVPQRPIARDECAIPLATRAVAAAARRAHEHAVAALQHVLLAVVDAGAVDADVAQAAGGAAGEAGGGELRALGHDAEHDGTRRAALDQDVLAQAAAEAAGAAGAGAQALVVEEERALALGHLDRRRRDGAGPREHVLAVLDRPCAHAAVEEQDRRVGPAVLARA